jgi:hypothetical protein
MASATDIITYVGVPLAVIGVLPTMYTFSKSYVTARSIRRTLASHGIGALVRSSPLSGIVEVEVPRKSIVPLDRDDENYFKLGSGGSIPSDERLRGGAWAIFNWRELVIGSKVLRLQYHDELTLPQAEVELEQLIAFLMDRGAVPDINGWADLRGSGLWTPAGTRLLLSPDTIHSVLSVASSEDSEGLLSLRVEWRPEWDRRTINDLPPYWMTLKDPRDGSGALGFAGMNESVGFKPDTKDAAEVSNSDEPEKHASLAVGQSPKHKRQSSGQFLVVVNPPDDEPSPRRPSTSRTSIYSHIPRDFPLTTVRMRFGTSGLEDLRPDDDPRRRRLLPRHLRTFRNEPPTSSAVAWFASAATALHAPYGGLWAYSIPSGYSTMAALDTVPCGVLELLGMFPSVGSLPTWRSKPDVGEEDLERIKRQENLLQWTAAVERERHMTPAERQKAVTKRMMEEAQKRSFETQKQRVEEERQRAAEQVEALNSARVGIRVVSDAALTWLRAKGFGMFTEEEESQGSEKKSGASSETEVEREIALREIVERVLWEMLRSVEVTAELSCVLDAWKNWVDNGGMTQVQFALLKEKQVAFAYAACVIALIAEATNGDSGNSVVEDLQECLRVWKRVRVG